MINRLEAIENRYNEISNELLKPEVVSDIKKMTELSKEQRRLNPIVELYNKYKDQGFIILDFPCNQFFGQAPGSSEEIHTACVLRFNIAFPQFEKLVVNGKDEHPFYRYLKDNCPVRTGKAIKWNFTKFLVDKEGNIINRFEPTDKPSSFEDKIKELL